MWTACGAGMVVAGAVGVQQRDSAIRFRNAISHTHARAAFLFSQ